MRQVDWDGSHPPSAVVTAQILDDKVVPIQSLRVRAARTCGDHCPLSRASPRPNSIDLLQR